MTHMPDGLIQRRIARSKKSILLLGPRQVGKSTLAQPLRPLRSVSLADESIALRYAKDPSDLRGELETAAGGGLVLLDEVQRVPALLNTVQTILDASGSRFRFLLTGSSARKLKRGGANLLPGRVILEHLDPLSALELDQVHLPRALQVGMLPGIYLGDEEATAVLETYVEVYLREEIRAEALTKNVGGYARFLDTIAMLSGRWLNYTKISSDTEIPKETVRRFVTILEDTLLLFRLPSFQPRSGTTRRVAQRERILLFDVGVRNALLSLHRRAVPPNAIGELFEQWIILQVIYLNRALRKGWRLSSYRTEGGADVDLVVETTRRVIGIEIKASRNVATTDLRGLRSLEEFAGRKPPLTKVLATFLTHRRRFDDGSEALPWHELLALLEAEE